MTIDLRSDTVTQPTEGDVRGRCAARPSAMMGAKGDPTVVRLEALAAERTGKEAGLFVVSGTMGNLVALLAHTGRGGEVIAEAGSHILALRDGRHRRARRALSSRRPKRTRRHRGGDSA